MYAYACDLFNNVCFVRRSVMQLLNEMETKIWNRNYQLNKRIEELNIQTRELIKQLDKERNDKEQGDRRYVYNVCIIISCLITITLKA